MKVITPDGTVRRFDVEPKLQKIFSDFTNSVSSGDDTAYVCAVETFKKEWKLSPEQKAIISVILCDTEVLMDVCTDKETLKDYYGSARNILQCVLDGYWNLISDFFLSGRARTIVFMREMKYMRENKKINN